MQPQFITKIKMTTVINLFGGPGCGKSTVASLLYGELNAKGKNVELVQECAKSWVYFDRKPGEYDPLYFLGQQSFNESVLYGKVDYIVTDSPILLAGVYQEYQSQFLRNYVKIAARKFMQHAESNGIVYHNFLLARPNSYNRSGRFENLEQAKELDDLISTSLSKFSSIDGPESFRHLEILQILNL